MCCCRDEFPLMVLLLMHNNFISVLKVRFIRQMPLLQLQSQFESILNQSAFHKFREEKENWNSVQKLQNLQL